MEYPPGGSPENFFVNAKILVHQYIADRLHLVPGKVWIALLHLGWHGAGKLYHGGKFKCHSVGSARILQKVVKAHSLREIPDVMSANEDILNAFQLSSRRHEWPPVTHFLSSAVLENEG